MAKLIINPTSSSRREIALARTIVSIGRDPSNDVVLPDAMVSRRHAVIEYRGSQYFLRDCNSSNGSLVNGDRVSERNLRDGDLVAIGTARLLFREEMEDAGAKVVPHPSAPRQVCPTCQTDYRKGDMFCKQCGTSLAPVAPARVVCTACGTAVLLPARFCNACGQPLKDPPARGGEDGPEITGRAPSRMPLCRPPAPPDDAGPASSARPVRRRRGGGGRGRNGIGRGRHAGCGRRGAAGSGVSGGARLERGRHDVAASLAARAAGTAARAGLRRSRR